MSPGSSEPKLSLLSTVSTQRNKLVVLALFASALTLSVGLSSRQPIRDFELNRMALSERIEDVVLRVAEQGVLQLASPATKQACASVPSESVPAAFFAAWAKLSLARVGLLSETTSLRLPWLVLVSLSPPLLFIVLRTAFGFRCALFAAVLLLAAPAFRNAGAIGSPGVIAASTWLLVLTPYMSSLATTIPERRMRRCFAVLTAVAAGMAASLSWAALWVLPFIAVHYAVFRGDLSRVLARRARLVAPTALLFSLGATPIFLILLNPAHWGASATSIARSFLMPLRAPEFVDRSFALFRVVPLALLLFAISGLLLLWLRKSGRELLRSTYPNTTASRAAVVLIVLGSACTLLAPFVVPRVLASSASHSEVIVPFLCGAAAIFVSAVAAHVSAGRFRLGIELLAVALVMLGP